MFEEIHKKLGFGCMRLPMKGDEVDHEEFCRMVDHFMAEGFNYFDTAHGYINGKSETAIREGLVKRYPRDSFLLTDKLTDTFFESEKEIRPFFEKQLEWCGVEYFDFYLMHAQNADHYRKFRRCHAYEQALALKEEGKVRHVGISFHDKPEVLEQILKDYPWIEIVQIQLNYLDFEDLSVEARRVYEVCEKHDKPVIVMEPVKGGSLAVLPEKAQKILEDLQKEEGKAPMSNASYAIRFAAGFPKVVSVLSGMSSLSQMKDNVSYMKDFVPLNERERKAVEEVTKVFHEKDMIPCTGCRYCVEENHCPKDIRIPDLFASYNSKAIFGGWNALFYYREVISANSGKASDCIQCGKCEKVCPQHLPIREYLKETAQIMEKKG